ncbi:tumor protein p63-regulated gene 1 protein isoform X2 [Varanus komodoensis]|uniref:tumor protein p63-regulated gene 1 protein isoform X2 n=1 Tax=Varanus komodoensis TaxID=61221 RepID=UPI001CF7B3BB|nr:tumor protein p63-regulated gene 1 protein isoform X2 [Varanus komodoensis]
MGVAADVRAGLSPVGNILFIQKRQEGGDGFTQRSHLPLRGPLVESPTPKRRSLGIGTVVLQHPDFRLFSQAAEMSAAGNAQEFQTAEMQNQPEEKGPGNRGAEPPADPILAGAPSPASKSVLYPRPHEDLHDSRKYFVSRPGAFDQAMDDLEAHVVANMGEKAHSFWLLTEIDHWNNEKERVLVITDSALLICKYDFIMLKCLQLQRVPLGSIKRISQGPFAFPERSLDKRGGEGLRIFWDGVREPTFLSRWNPWATDLPFATFMEHPVKHFCQRLSTICQMI